MQVAKPMWKHQEQAVNLCLIHDNYMLAIEMGGGKTRCMIEALRRRFAANHGLMRTIIFCPIIVTQNWKNEFAMYSKIDPKDIIILTGSGEQRCKQFIKNAGDDLARPKIFITNYQSMLMLKLSSLFSAYCPEIIICDESQRLKSPTAKTAKTMFYLAQKARHKYLLTGTPILNSPMDIFQQFKIMDNGATFGLNYMTFKLRYFEDKNAKFKNKAQYFPKWEVREDRLPELSTKIESKSMRVLKSECLDLPPLVKQTVFVELSKEQDRMYEEMRKEFVTFIDSQKGPRAVIAELAITKAMRMQQIVTGFARDEHGNDHALDCPRLAVLEELLEDLTPNHKVIVWACFHQNYADIRKVCEKLKLKYVELHGEIDHKLRLDNMTEFRSNPEVRVVIANQRAAGLGINLVEASYSIYYSKNHSLEDQLQSESRNHRGGSEMHEKITQIDLVARGTIDELINQALSQKLKVAEFIMDKKGDL